MRAPLWQVWIGDLRGSRRFNARQRATVARHLLAALEATSTRYKSRFKLLPTVLRGDEVQAVLTPDAPALTMLTYLRAQFAVRVGRTTALYAGIGLGAIPQLHARNAFESEGPAFHLARRALDTVKGAAGGALTRWVTDRPEFDAAAEAMLPLLDGYFRRWTGQQWEAVRHRIEEKTLQVIARQLGVRSQAVHKRLSTAQWSEVAHAIGYLEAEHLRRLAGHPDRATPVPVQRAQTRRPPPGLGTTQPVRGEIVKSTRRG